MRNLALLYSAFFQKRAPLLRLSNNPTCPLHFRHLRVEHWHPLRCPASTMRPSASPASGALWRLVAVNAARLIWQKGRGTSWVSILALLLFLPFCPLRGETHPCLVALTEDTPTWKDKLRLKALENFDQFLNWSLSEKLRTFVSLGPLQEDALPAPIPDMQFFDERFGYFSLHRPIVAKVTTDSQDIEAVRCLLTILFDKGKKFANLELTTAEVLTKILAYRDLKQGQQIPIPIFFNSKVRLETFTVDRVFDLWHGMPAFGLTPRRKGIPSFLLFRGTDCSLTSQRGWASLLSDVDPSGPGLSVFQRAQEGIHQWLMQVKEKGNPAKVMGFSLGGALAAYTFIYENAQLIPTGSIAICPPGVDEKVIEDWHRLSEEKRKGLTVYVNRGDIVPKVGKLFGTVYVLSTPTPLRPLQAHTKLMCADPATLKSSLDVSRENASR